MATKETKKEKTVTKESQPKILKGKVVSTKMKDTIVVEVYRYVKHPKYQKFLNIRKRYKAHDAGNTKTVGEVVEIRECRPISKDKHHIIHNS